MLNRYILAISLSFVSLQSFAQAYWQQRVDTRMEVTLDDKKHMLRGHEEFTYTNNSPDTLKYLYIHLWPNGYKHDHTQFAEQKYRNGDKAFYYAKPSERGYIDSLNFTVNGVEVLYFSTDPLPDIARIDLPSPLAPGGTIKVATPFRVKLPKVFSRLGHTGQAYFISQWFPKPAVYDRKGWHPMPYLDLGEFYSEIGSYDVSITLPKNYVLMGTGNIMNEEEQAWLDDLATKPIDTSRKPKMAKVTGIDSIPPSSVEMKKVRFTEDNIHDFAWFADKRWIVRKDTVASGAGVTDVYSAFLPSYRYSWLKGNTHLKNAVKYYGKWVGPYPYKTIKAVQGDMSAGGGMEYPTVTIIDRTSGGDATTIIHEAGHNWFYGIFATNERDHAWMDEGLNTFYEIKTTNAVKNDTTGKRKLSTPKGGGIDVSGISILAELQASGKDEPIEQTSNNFKEINYGMDVYYKTAYLLKWLEGYMGPKAFEEGMHEYYDTWKHKHPYPEDFKAVMQKHSDRSINWFFESALHSDRMYDFSVQSVKTGGNSIEVKVKNKTGLLLPVSVVAYQGDSMVATAWSGEETTGAGGTKVITTPGSDVFTGTTTIHLPKDAYDWTSIQINPVIPDWRTQNNRYKRGGLFHRSGVQLKPLAGMDMGNKHKIFVAPALGYNMYDGFMAGLLFHNLTWPETKFKYIVAPLYGFGSKEFVGAGSIGYNWFPHKGLKEVMLQADIKSFHNYKQKEGYYSDSMTYFPDDVFLRYTKIAPSVTFTFRQNNPLSTVKRTLMLKGYFITEEGLAFNQDPVDSLFRPGITSTQNTYSLLRYTHKNDRPFNPFSYSFEGQMGEYFAKLSLEGNIRLDYNRKKKALYIRGYAGKFITIKDEFPTTDRYYLNSTFTGVNDYLYDDTYIGRTETDGFGARQISMREGGFKIPTPLNLSPLGRSDDWLAALNIKTDLPIKLPLRLFLDIGTFANAKEANPSGQKVLYAGGVEIFAWDVVNIYVPLVMSKDFNDYRKSMGQDGILDGITFSINLQKINWLKAPSGVFKVMGY